MLSDDEQPDDGARGRAGRGPPSVDPRRRPPSCRRRRPRSRPPPTRPPPRGARPPLPAQAVLEATPIVTRPRDALTKAASDAAQINTRRRPSSDTAPPGHEGGYQLQVSSFRTQAEAQAFADQLRARGHKAYVVEAHVPGRGTWFRVRVGPFATQHAAPQYRAGFEAREHVVPFIVPPERSPRRTKRWHHAVRCRLPRTSLGAQSVRASRAHCGIACSRGRPRCRLVHVSCDVRRWIAVALGLALRARVRCAGAWRAGRGDCGSALRLRSGGAGAHALHARVDAIRAPTRRSGPSQQREAHQTTAHAGAEVSAWACAAVSDCMSTLSSLEPWVAGRVLSVIVRAVATLG